MYGCPLNCSLTSFRSLFKYPLIRGAYRHSMWNSIPLTSLLTFCLIYSTCQPLPCVGLLGLPQLEYKLCESRAVLFAASCTQNSIRRICLIIVNWTNEKSESKHDSPSALAQLGLSWGDLHLASPCPALCVSFCLERTSELDPAIISHSFV